MGHIPHQRVSSAVSLCHCFLLALLASGKIKRTAFSSGCHAMSCASVVNGDFISYFFILCYQPSSLTSSNKNYHRTCNTLLFSGILRILKLWYACPGTLTFILHIHIPHCIEFHLKWWNKLYISWSLLLLHSREFPIQGERNTFPRKPSQHFYICLSSLGGRHLELFFFHRPRNFYFGNL